MHMTTVSTDAERAARMRDFAELDRQKEKDEERKRKNPPFVQLTESRMSDLRKHLRHNPWQLKFSCSCLSTWINQTSSFAL